MEEDLDGVVLCSSLTVEAMIRFGATGAIWGLCADSSTSLTHKDMVYQPKMQYIDIFQLKWLFLYELHGLLVWQSHIIHCCFCTSFLFWVSHIAPRQHDPLVA
eukprot:XP_014619789.1 uncharacterized protein LOC102670073 [Glycine max]